MLVFLTGMFSLAAIKPGHDQLCLSRLRTCHFSPWNRTARGKICNRSNETIKMGHGF